MYFNLIIFFFFLSFKFDYREHGKTNKNRYQTANSGR